jgi:hypothetical protein
MDNRENMMESARGTRRRLQGELAKLLEARAACEAQLSDESRIDPIKRVTGLSSLERAIEDTKRMIEVLRRAEEEAGRGQTATGGEGPTGLNAVAGRAGPLGVMAPELKLATVRKNDLEIETEELAVVGVIGPRPAAAVGRSGILFSSRTNVSRYSGLRG